MRTVMATICILGLFVAGCVQIKHGDSEYTRLGSQELGEVYIELDPNGVSRMSIGQQKSDFQLGFEAGKFTIGGAE